MGGYRIVLPTEEAYTRPELSASQASPRSPLHGIDVRAVAKQGPNVGCKTYGHDKTPAAGIGVTLKCRVALLTSLYFAGLKAWEAIETIHLGIAGIFQVGRVDYTTRKRNPEANWDDPSHQCSDLRRP